MAQTDNVEAVKINVEPAKKSIGELKKEIEQTNKQLELLDRDSDAFAQCATKASQLQKELIEVNQTIELSNKGILGIAEATAQTAAGLVGGFQSAQAALNLFGVESEATTEAIAKMQSMMALTQGLQSVAQGIKSFKTLASTIKTATAASKGLKVALASTGIGLAAIAVAELVAHFDDLQAAWQKLMHTEPVPTDKQLAQMDEYNGKLKTAQASLGSLYQEWEDYQASKEMSSEANARVTQLKSEIKMLEEMQKAAAEAMENDKYASEEARKQNEENYGKITVKMKQLRAEVDEIIKTKGADIDASVAQAKAQEKVTEKVEDTAKEMYALKEAQIALKAAEDEEYAKSASYYLDTLSLQRQKLKGMQEGTSEYVRQQVEIEKTKNAIKALYTEAGVLDNTGDTSELILQDIETRLAKLRFDTIAGSISQQEAINEQIMLEEMKLAEIEKGTAAYYNQLAVVEQLKQGTKEATKGASDWAQVAVQGLNLMGQSLSAFASLQDTTTEEGFEQQKRLQISATVMNMLGGILSAWVSAMNPANAWMTLPGQIAMGVAQTVATAALGAAQIKQIQSTQFGAEGSGATNSASAINSTVIAPTQYNNAVQGAQTQATIGAQKVYVTEGEITATQGRVSVAESEAKF